jgi:hypothetical protein
VTVVIARSIVTVVIARSIVTVVIARSIVTVVIASPERAKQSHKKSYRGLIHQARILIMRLLRFARNDTGTGEIAASLRSSQRLRRIATLPSVARNDRK